MRLILALILCLPSFAASLVPHNPHIRTVVSSGVSFYVDNTGGNDANAGTSSGAPWKTLAKVETSATAGSTVYFKRGETWTLQGGTHPGIDTLQDSMLVIPASGITLAAYGSGALPVFDCGATYRVAVIVDAGITNTHTTFLKLYNGTGGVPMTGALYETLSNGGTNWLEDCWMDKHDIDTCVGNQGTGRLVMSRCTISRAADEGFTMHNGSATITSCVFSNNSAAMNFSGTGMQMTCNDSVFAENGDGVTSSSSLGDICSLSDGTFTFNRCLFRGRADGGDIRFYEGSTGETTTFNYCVFNNRTGASLSKGALVIESGCTAVFNNCDFRGNSGADGRAGQFLSTGAVTFNNSIFDYWWRILRTGGTVAEDHCIFHSVGTNDFDTDTNQVSTGDPLFVDVTTDDFHLTAGSPAINAGTNLSLTPDFYGATVANPPEVGAAEF